MNHRSDVKGDPDLRLKVTVSSCLLQHAAIPGPPFLFGACAVVLAMVVAFFIPENLRPAAGPAAAKPAHAQNGGAALATPTSDTEDIEPLLQDSSM